MCECIRCDSVVKIISLPLLLLSFEMLAHGINSGVNVGLAIQNIQVYLEIYCPVSKIL